jgi:hypothetical protein
MPLSRWRLSLSRPGRTWGGDPAKGGKQRPVALDIQVYAANGADASFLLQGQGIGQGETGQHHIGCAKPHNNIPGKILDQPRRITLLRHNEEQARMRALQVYGRAETLTDIRCHNASVLLPMKGQMPTTGKCSPPVSLGSHPQCHSPDAHEQFVRTSVYVKKYHTASKNNPADFLWKYSDMEMSGQTRTSRILVRRILCSHSPFVEIAVNHRQHCR